MKKVLLIVVLLFAGAGAAVAAVAETTGTVSVCSSTPNQTIAANGSPIATLPGDTECATTTYTVPTLTNTVTNTTTETVTVTVPTTTTTPTTTSPPPPAFTPGIGVVNESGALDTAVTNPNQYAQLVGGAWGNDVPTVLEKAPGLGLAYFNGADVKQSFSTGVPYSDALANGWLLKDSAGNYLVNSTYGSYCADIGSSGYRQEWVTNVKNYLAAHVGVDGIFIDNTLYDPKADCGAYPVKYPTTATYSAAMLGFVQAVYAALHPLGYYVELNATAYKAGDGTYDSGASTAAWWNQLAPYADGLMDEYYAETTGLALRSFGTDNWAHHWEGWQQLIGVAQSAGDDFVGLTKSSGMNTAYAVYGRASMLLEWDGGGSTYDYTCGNSCDPTNSSWTANVGSPLAAKVAVGVGYRRDYSNATVLVNPSPTTSQTFTVNGTSYTLAHTTAKIIP